MVAMFGSSMAAPLATPPTVKAAPLDVTPLTSVVLGAVSVVIIARAAVGPPSAVMAAATTGMAGAMASIGSW